MHSWRKFQFFTPQFHKLNNSNEEKQSLSFILENPITCHTTGRKHIIFGDQNGISYFINQNFMVEFEQQLFDISISHLYELSQQNILLAIGIDDAKTNQQLIKFIDLGSQKNSEDLICIKTIKINNTKNSDDKIVSVAVLDDLSRIVLCFSNGLLLMIFGDLLHDRVPKQHAIPGTDEEDTPIITKVLFRQQLYFSLDERVRVLYCVSENQTFCYHITGNQEYRKMILQDIGAQPESVNISMNGELILGKDEGVFYFTPENPGSCFGFEGKKILTEFRSYLAIFTTTNNNKNISFSIYDVKNKYIALTKRLKNNILYLLNQWGSLFLITDSKEVIQFDEKGLKTKLDFLFTKKLYNVAIDLAHSQQYDQSEIYEMFKRYGDHLELKGDYSGAITQYINTIGQTPPSYVIRKFLDPQRIHNLTKYLQALHEKGVANSEHTTLLLNCYTKLKDTQKLDAFIKQESQDGPKFDVDTAIVVLRSSGYYNYALYLAKKYQENDLYLRIHLEETNQYITALEFIKTLQFKEAESSLKKYGNTLMDKAPKETTDLLFKLCTGYKAEKNSSIQINNEKNEERLIKTEIEIENEIGMEKGKEREREREKENGHEKNKDQDKDIDIEIEIENNDDDLLNSGIEGTNFNDNDIITFDDDNNDEDDDDDDEDRSNLFKERFGSISNQSKKLTENDPNVNERNELFGNINKKEKKIEKSNNDHYILNDDQYPKSNPSNFIHTFVEHPNWLISFLENIIEIQIDSEPIIYNTLLELYLRKDIINSKNEDEKQKKIRNNRGKAIKLLKNPNSRYEKEHALVLVQMYKFTEGVTYMLEKLEFYHEIIQTHIENEDHQNIIKSCKKYAHKDQGLWLLALNYFVKSESDCSQEIVQVLSEIKKENLLSPLMVIQILSKNKKITLEIIQDYLTSLLKENSNKIEKNNTNIQKYVHDTKAIQEKLLLKKTKATQFQSSRCSLCNNPLELPSLHFLCGHSIHYRCLVGNEITCPLCNLEASQISDRVSSIQEKIGKHDEFFRLIRESNDGFSVIAKHFGRGLLSEEK
ncbi:vacuolar protein sorting-associated protein [Anaeramoeba flamelloides]|uniref:Vacuolar protein sorting-associated protein 11 homolog n=1 Tax=Anaeramoeba flamelloides TaxID=1746091 RepID=A0ABQ8X3B4_9EUKA|nr:vacuolar protein sorting-associated protein [Anaeramoeba flamelloides]